MISAILSGLALHLTDSYSFGAIPYGLVFVSRDDLSNTVGVGATPYGLVFVSRDVLSNTVVFGATTYGFNLECSKFLAMGLIIFMIYIASCRMDHFMILADFSAFTYM